MRRVDFAAAGAAVELVSIDAREVVVFPLARVNKGLNPPDQRAACNHTALKPRVRTADAIRHLLLADQVHCVMSHLLASDENHRWGEEFRVHIPRCGEQCWALAR